MPDGAARPIYAWPLTMRAERAAACLDVSPTYFREHIAPELRPIRRGKGMVLYRLADLQAWADRQADGEAALDPAAPSAPASEPNPWHR